jgi:nitroimidazol reductase NimA-like FMN-containing flavoprotein (pyridoxamine 5'-phosphate oxidase superfamily)
MVIQEMTQEECRSRLAGRHIVRLACARNNQPYVIPIQVDFEDDCFYAYTTLGQKIEWMRQNPLVCLELDAVAAAAGWETIVVFGRYEELPPTTECGDCRRVAERLFQTHPMWWEPASVPLAGEPLRPPVVFRIHLTRVTGRRAIAAEVARS